MRKSKIFVIVVALFLLSIATTYGLVDAYNGVAKTAPLTAAQLQNETQNNSVNNGSNDAAEAAKELFQIKKSRIISGEDAASTSKNSPAEDETSKKDNSEPATKSEEKATEKSESKAVTRETTSNYSQKTTTKEPAVTETKKTVSTAPSTVESSKATAEKAAAEKAAAEKAAAEKAAAEKAAAEKAAAEKAAAEKAAAEKAAAEKAAAEKAAAEKAAKPTRADGTPNQEYVDQMYSLINQERAAAGKSALKLDAALCNAAQLKAEDMMKKGYFAHKSPTYGNAFEMMNYLGIGYRTAAENIAYGYRTPEGCMKGFMNSSGHKCNILDQKGYGYTKVGVGYAIGSDGMTYWAQIFCG